MKERLTINEVTNLISMINSSDEETLLFGLRIILSKSYKTTRQLNTAIYNAHVAVNSYNKYRSERGKYWYELEKAETNREKCIAALERYKKKIRAV